jgi:hypothetical protein
MKSKAAYFFISLKRNQQSGQGRSASRRFSTQLSTEFVGKAELLFYPAG